MACLHPAVSRQQWSPGAVRPFSTPNISNDQAFGRKERRDSAKNGEGRQNETTVLVASALAISFDDWRSGLVFGLNGLVGLRGA
jgi:hypothetical protein